MKQTILLAFMLAAANFEGAKTGSRTELSCLPVILGVSTY